MDKEELVKEIYKHVSENIKIECSNGNHNFVPLNNGTLDVICTRCGIKAMGSVARV